MLKVYGSELCPDCVACKSAFDANNLPYDFVNITGSMRNLKEFLRLRDASPVFENAKKNGYVGIPAIMKENGDIVLDWEECLKEAGASAPAHEKAGNACRIDGTGC